jgi:hypothetical protein
MPDYLQELSRKYGKLLAQRTTQWGDSTRQYGVPGQTNVRAGNRTEADFTPLLDRLNNSVIGASVGLLGGGPLGALAGAVVPQLYGLHPEVDRVMDANMDLPTPAAPFMAVVPLMTKLARRGKLGATTAKDVAKLSHQLAWTKQAKPIDNLINARNSVYHATDLEGFKGILEAGEISPNPWLHQGLGTKKQKELMKKPSWPTIYEGSIDKLNEAVEVGQLHPLEAELVKANGFKSFTKFTKQAKAKLNQLMVQHKDDPDAMGILETVADYGNPIAKQQQLFAVFDLKSGQIIHDGLSEQKAQQITATNPAWDYDTTSGSTKSFYPTAGVSVSRVPRIAPKATKAISFVIDRSKMPRNRGFAEEGYQKTVRQGPSSVWDALTDEEFYLHNSLSDKAAALPWGDPAQQTIFDQQNAIMQTARQRMLAQAKSVPNKHFEFEDRTYNEPIGLDAVKGVLVDKSVAAENRRFPNEDEIAQIVKHPAYQQWARDWADQTHNDINALVPSDIDDLVASIKDNRLALALDPAGHDPLSKRWNRLTQSGISNFLQSDPAHANGIYGDIFTNQISQLASQHNLPVQVYPSGRAMHSARALLTKRFREGADPPSLFGGAGAAWLVDQMRKEFERQRGEQGQ